VIRPPDKGLPSWLVYFRQLPVHDASVLRVTLDDGNSTEATVNVKPLPAISRSGVGFQEDYDDTVGFTCPYPGSNVGPNFTTTLWVAPPTSSVTSVTLNGQPGAVSQVNGQWTAQFNGLPVGDNCSLVVVGNDGSSQEMFVNVTNASGVVRCPARKTILG
jgi:hypothetical protein